MKRVLAFVLVFMLLLSVCAVSVFADGVTLNALFMKQAGYSEDDVVAMTQAFTESTGIQVNPTFVAYEELAPKILTSAASGGYDVILGDCIWPAQFAKAGLVLDVTDKVEVDIDSEELDQRVGEENADKLREDLELVDGVYPEFDVETYREAEVAPVFFGSALNNFGVQELLNCFVEIAPSPRPTKAEERDVQPEEPKFTGFIFKITANIDPNHRSCIAFCKVCSGKFVRNQPYLHVRQGKSLRFSSPTQFMAQRKSTIDEAWPGDIVGLPDTGGMFKIGDTLTEGEKLHFRGLPSFSPELFKYIENDDPMKAKQLQKGIDQLMDEGVAQLFVNQFNNRKIIGTVGQLQFEVIQYRLENEYNAKCRWEPVHLYKACWIESDDPQELENFKKRKYQYMAKDKEGRDVFLADSSYVLSMAQQDFENIKFHFTSEF